MPARTISARRSRSEVEDDEVADLVRASERQSPSGSDSSAKRLRTDGYSSQSETSDLDGSRAQQSGKMRSHRNGNDDLDEETDIDGNEFQPGAIVRVKLTNFVTYESAEFYPGPNLNMVIGPNGTGKSSLVCAICLGLGWGPQHLGRASQVGEFVKHGMNDAIVEIELQRRSNEVNNHIVRLRIIRDGNGREWWLDGRKTSLKAVQALMKGLSIQIDNLCQFLPQDKVSEFAALSPVELLQQTQRAAAPEEMLEWHEELKQLRKEQRSFQFQHQADIDTLGNLESRQEGARTEVARLEERKQIQEKISLLEKSIPFVEYRVARAQHNEYKERKKAAQRRLKELEKEVEPTLRSVNEKQIYQAEINVVVKERRKAVEQVERVADSLLQKMDKIEEAILETDQKRQAERDGDLKRKQDLQRIQAKIRNLEAGLHNERIHFNSAEWNERIVSI